MFELLLDDEQHSEAQLVYVGQIAHANLKSGPNPPISLWLDFCVPGEHTVLPEGA